MANRSTLRILALAVLALLGAPLAMHVVVHDLHGHHDDEHEIAFASADGHGGHEHPIVFPATPQVPSLTRATIPAATTLAPATSWRCVARAERNVVAFGALRVDTDVGFQPLLATYLI